MPDSATWDDLIHETCVREAIENALADSREGQTDVSPVSIGSERKLT